MRRQALERERAASDAPDSAADFASAAVRRALLRRASRIRQALLDHRDQAREVLHALVNRITSTPFGRGRGRGYAFEGTGDYGALFGKTRRLGGVPDVIRPEWSTGFRGVPELRAAAWARWRLILAAFHARTSTAGRMAALGGRTEHGTTAQWDDVERRVPGIPAGASDPQAPPGPRGDGRARRQGRPGAARPRPRGNPAGSPRFG
jgi:hypothetical protein